MCAAAAAAAAVMTMPGTLLVLASKAVGGRGSALVPACLQLLLA
jgi:hypothetical protein